MADKRSGHIPEKRRSALVIVPSRGGNDEIVTTLKREGFRVTSVETVYEGVAEFTREPAKLVIISLEGLARRDRKALRIFQRRAPEVRVLLLVPEGRRRDVPAFLSAGADAIMPAPIYGRELKLIVRAMLRGDAADPLTGLANREAYERAFEREVSRAKRGEQGLALAILDLDKFGLLNSRYGFAVANEVLCETADRLKDTIRITDLVTRWGGDEFVALITRLPTELEDARKQARIVLERCRERMEDEFLIGSKRIRASFKGGVAFYPSEGESRLKLFDRANWRIQTAGRQGGNCIVYDDDQPEQDPSAAA